MRAFSQAVSSKTSAVDAALASYEKCQKYRHLNAFTFLPSKKVLTEKAHTIDQDPSNFPLRGLTFVVKDNFCVTGMPTTCASNMLYDFIPPYTATVVKKLQDAGAIIIGKTNLDEFGMGNGTLDSVFGPTKNIWGLEKFRSKRSYYNWHVPGGSSGGSAVAVAAGLCDVALGSDTGGSTRNPASYCGVVGLKPTYGLLSRHGLIPLVNSLDVPGIIGRNVEDVALVFDNIKGVDRLDSTTVNIPVESCTSPGDYTDFVKNLKVGVSEDYKCSQMSEEVIACLNEVISLLKQNGVSIKNVSLPHTKHSIVCYSVLNPCEVASNMARYDGLRYGHRSFAPKENSTEALYAQTRKEGFNTVVRGRILSGNYFLLKSNYEKYFVKAMKVRRLIAKDFQNVFQNEVDVLLTPVTLSSAPLYSDFIKLDNRTQTSLQDYCTQPVNMAGLPAMSIPIRLDQNGVPLSLQLIGPKYAESSLFKVAKFIENLVQFHKNYV